MGNPAFLRPMHKTRGFPSPLHSGFGFILFEILERLCLMVDLLLAPQPLSDSRGEASWSASSSLCTYMATACFMV